MSQVAFANPRISPAAVPRQRSSDGIQRFGQRDRRAVLAEGKCSVAYADIAEAWDDRSVLRNGISHVAAAGIDRTRHDRDPWIRVDDIPATTGIRRNSE